MADVEGPWVQMAFFCEDVIAESEGMFSYLRVLNAVTFEPKDFEREDDSQPVTTVKLVIGLMSGAEVMSGQLRVEAHYPGFATFPIETTDLQFDEETRRVIFVNDIGLPGVQLQGTLWFNVYWEDRVLSRIPLELDFTREPQAGEEA